MEAVRRQSCQSCQHWARCRLFCLINARNTQERPGRRKGSVFQRSFVAILIHTKKETLIFVKENLSNSGPVVTTIANVFCLSSHVPQGGNRLQSYVINNITTSVDKYGF